MHGPAQPQPVVALLPNPGNPGRVSRVSGEHKVVMAPTIEFSKVTAYRDDAAGRSMHQKEASRNRGPARARRLERFAEGHAMLLARHAIVEIIGLL